MFGSGRAVRASSAIRAYVGENGGGKTLAAVYDLLPSLARGRRVLSTTPLLDPVRGGLHRGFVPLSSWRQLVEAEHCDVFLDEVTGVASARSYASLPSQLLQLFVQLRKRDVTLSWTTPNYARADVVLREVTRTVTVCKGYLPRPSPNSRWPQNRLFSWTTYDAVDWEEFSLQKAERVKEIAHQWHWRPGKPAERAYRTGEASLLLDHMDVTGTCLACGGKRTAPRCSCPVEGVEGDAPAGEAPPGADPPGLDLDPGAYFVTLGIRDGVTEQG